MKNTVVVTGGAGYIGSGLVDALIAKGARVVVIDDLSSGKKENVNKEAMFYKVDIYSPKIFTILKMWRPDYIFHLAASKDVNKSINNPMEFAKINVLGSINIINSAHKLGIKKIIFTSTAGVYGNSTNGLKQKENDVLNPSSLYAWTKLSIEEYLIYMNRKGTENVILRFANVYGPGGNSPYKSVVNIFIEKLLKNQTITIHGNGSQTRDFVFIDESVDICQHVAEVDFAKIKENPIFNVSTGKEISVTNLLKLISGLAKIVPNISYEKGIFSGQARSILAAEKTKEVLGWSAKISLEKGLLKTLDFYKKRL